jgi:cell division protein FtsN
VREKTVARDYKPAPTKQKSSSGKGSTFFTGFLVGLITGIGVSVGVAIFVTKGESPFVDKVATPAQPDNGSSQKTVPSETPAAETAETTSPDKRFDFYNILPSTESQLTEQEVKQSAPAQQPSPTPAASEKYYLQVGAFKTEQEADNMKAKLALLGLEAVVQTVNAPDNGVWHRVRVGPYSEIDQITKVRTELTSNGFKADLIKSHSEVPDQ